MPLALERFMGLPLIWLSVALVLLVLHRYVTRWRNRRAGVARPIDEEAVRLLARAYLPAGLLAGGYFSLQLLPLGGPWLRFAERGLGALASIFAIWVAWRGFALLLHRWAENNPNAQTLVPPVQLFGRVFGAAIGIALVLSALGFSLTKVWAALGIGSIAIALALQDTLSNSFAGFHIMLDQPFRVGDWIKMDSGEEGRVIQIGWRSTRMHTGPNNILVVPNSKLSKASITNYSLPQPRLVLTIPVPVSYDSNPRHVRRVLEDVVAGAAREVTGLLPDPPPAVRFTSIADNALNFSVICHVRDVASQQDVQDELRCRLVERFHREGIRMATPSAAGRTEAVPS